MLLSRTGAFCAVFIAGVLLFAANAYAVTNSVIFASGNTDTSTTYTSSQAPTSCDDGTYYYGPTKDGVANQTVAQNDAIQRALGLLSDGTARSVDTKDQTGTIDACFGAVLKTGKQPSQNKADYQCVGRQGWVYVVQGAGAPSSVTVVTLPIAGSQPGTCSIQVCQGSEQDAQKNPAICANAVIQKGGVSLSSGGSIGTAQTPAALPTSFPQSSTPSAPSAAGGAGGSSILTQALMNPTPLSQQSGLLSAPSSQAASDFNTSLFALQSPDGGQSASDSAGGLYSSTELSKQMVALEGGDASLGATPSSVSDSQVTTGGIAGSDTFGSPEASNPTFESGDQNTLNHIGQARDSAQAEYNAALDDYKTITGKDQWDGQTSGGCGPGDVECVATYELADASKKLNDLNASYAACATGSCPVAIQDAMSQPAGVIAPAVGNFANALTQDAAQSSKELSDLGFLGAVTHPVTTYVDLSHIVVNGTVGTLVGDANTLAQGWNILSPSVDTAVLGAACPTCASDEMWGAGERVAATAGTFLIGGLSGTVADTVGATAIEDTTAIVGEDSTVASAVVDNAPEVSAGTETATPPFPSASAGEGAAPVAENSVPETVPEPGSVALPPEQMSDVAGISPDLTSAAEESSVEPSVTITNEGVTDSADAALEPSIAARQQSSIDWTAVTKASADEAQPWVNELQDWNQTPVADEVVPVVDTAEASPSAAADGTRDPGLVPEASPDAAAPKASADGTAGASAKGLPTPTLKTAVIGGGLIFGGAYLAQQKVAPNSTGGTSGTTNPGDTNNPSTAAVPAPADKTPAPAPDTSTPSPIKKLTVTAVPLGVPTGAGQPVNQVYTSSNSSPLTSIIGALVQGLSALFKHTSAQSTSNSITASTSSTNPPAPVVIIIANPSSILSGQKSLLSWSSVGMSACSVFAPGTVSIASTTEGSVFTSALASTTTFVAHCTAVAGGSATATTTVTVN